MAEDKKKDEIAIIEINEEFMKQKLYEFRGCKVLLDADLAEVYGYELKAFNQQVKRNIERFQNDMMFQLSDNEVEYLRSQFVTANISSKSRSNPYVFTEQGVYMLMTVLKGELAVRQSIAYVVDNYIGLRTLVHLKNSPTGVKITLFSDNVGNNKLHNIEYTDFCKNTVNATGHKCTFRRNIEQSQIDDMLAKLITAMTKEGKLRIPFRIRLERLLTQRTWKNSYLC